MLIRPFPNTVEQCEEPEESPYIKAFIEGEKRNTNPKVLWSDCSQEWASGLNMAHVGPYQPGNLIAYGNHVYQQYHQFKIIVVRL